MKLGLRIGAGLILVVVVGVWLTLVSNMLSTASSVSVVFGVALLIAGLSTAIPFALWLANKVISKEEK